MTQSRLTFSLVEPPRCHFNAHCHSPKEILLQTILTFEALDNYLYSTFRDASIIFTLTLPIWLPYHDNTSPSTAPAMTTPPTFHSYVDARRLVSAFRVQFYRYEFLVYFHARAITCFSSFSRNGQRAASVLTDTLAGLVSWPRTGDHTDDHDGINRFRHSFNTPAYHAIYAPPPA